MTQRDFYKSNDWMVSARGDMIRIIRVPMREMTKPEALGLAAWLVAVADDQNEFQRILEAVQNA